MCKWTDDKAQVRKFSVNEVVFFKDTIEAYDQLHVREIVNKLNMYVQLLTNIYMP